MVIHMVQGQMQMLKVEVKDQGHAPPQPGPFYWRIQSHSLCMQLDGDELLAKGAQSSNIFVRTQNEGWGLL